MDYHKKAVEFVANEPAILKALEAWFDSQGISKAEQGMVCAAYAGATIKHRVETRGRPLEGDREIGLLLLTARMEVCSR